MAIIAELYRGGILESVHHGHGVVIHANGDVLMEFGDPDRTVLPRSSSKMLQALPLIESGAADKVGLASEQLALACASHNGEPMHTERVRTWLSTIGLSEGDLRCGPQPPSLSADRRALLACGCSPGRIHNNCSGKHAGFLTLNQKLGGDAEYHQVDHPVQQAIHATLQEMLDCETAGYGIDGCSAPNFAAPLRAWARAAANMSLGEALGGGRGRAAGRLNDAMMAHPLLVSGTGRACAGLMNAGAGRVIAKTGAEGFFMAILPERNIGIALKCEDGATRGAETAIAALLVRLGVVDTAHPEIAKLLYAPLKNFAGLHVGDTRPGADIWGDGVKI